MKKFPQAALSIALSLALCATPILPQAYASEAKVLSGVASWYGPGFHGRTTANGERYNMNGLTAAHKSLKFGTKVRVTNQKNGKSVVVRINDRGPYVGSRIIDLSKSAAQAIDMIGPGTAAVKVEVLA
ncbi:septal ring lytic transglycosylase RlpA family protein [Devosia submarina]|uniref:septal ring lytic transglycosylase RlpA family protein n=1 Tax=Devosia submarina TaxID=1173082 RepID=UPI001AECD7BD|nr:septal ring lytic transglycosylase RlpA family protein [Devosia submarina]